MWRGYNRVQLQLGIVTTGCGYNWLRLQLGVATTGCGYKWMRLQLGAATTGCGYKWIRLQLGAATIFFLNIFLGGFFFSYYNWVRLQLGASIGFLVLGQKFYLSFYMKLFLQLLTADGLTKKV